MTPSMKPLRRLALFASLSVLLLAGCDPEKLLVWSPDGKRCAVIGPEGLHLADAEGNLSPLLLPHAVSAAWLPDSKRLAVQVKLESAKWADAEPLLDHDRRKRILERAERVLLLAKAVPQTDLEGLFESVADPEEESTADVALPMFVYLRDTRGKEMADRFGEAYTKHASEPITLGLVRIYDVTADQVQGAKLAERVTVAASFAGFSEIRPNPKSDVLALVEGASDYRRIMIATLDGKTPPKTVADLVARYPDWSHDGKSLLYVRANTPPDKNDSLRLGGLRRLTLLDESNKLLSPLPVDRTTMVTNADGSTNETPSSAEVLAGFLYSEWIKVRALPNGRVLFSGVEAQLPATAADMPTTPTLFAIDPNHPTISRVLPRGLDASLPAGVHHFEPSPDGARIALPGVGGQLAVVQLSTGNLTELSPRKSDQALKLIPAWRNNEELSYATLNPQDKKRPGEFTLFSVKNDAPKPLSKQWPEELVKALSDDRQQHEPTTPQNP